MELQTGDNTMQFGSHWGHADGLPCRRSRTTIAEPIRGLFVRGRKFLVGSADILLDQPSPSFLGGAGVWQGREGNGVLEPAEATIPHAVARNPVNPRAEKGSATRTH